MLGRSDDRCFVTDCTRRVSRRFEITEAGSPELSAYFRRSVPAGMLLCLCRRHDRELVRGLGLVPVLVGDDDPTSAEWTSLERLVFRFIDHGRSKGTALLGFIRTLLLFLLSAGFAIAVAIDGDVVASLVALGFAALTGLIAAAERRHWRRLVRKD